MVAPAIIAAGRVHAGLLAGLHASAMTPSWSGEAFAALLGQPGVAGWVASNDGEPSGFLLVRAAADEAEILTLAVTPAWRRHGIAHCLMTALLDWAAAHGLTRLHLEVAEDNEAARALYRGCGFGPVGRRADYYGAGRDALLLARPLSPPDA